MVEDAKLDDNNRWKRSVVCKLSKDSYGLAVSEASTSFDKGTGS